MGAVVVTLFSTIYPEYADMVCLMVPPRMSTFLHDKILKFRLLFNDIACEEYESDLVRRVRRGSMYLLLPATIEQFHSVADLLLMRKNVPKFFLELIFQERLPHLNTQRKRK